MYLLESSEDILNDIAESMDTEEGRFSGKKGSFEGKTNDRKLLEVNLIINI